MLKFSGRRLFWQRPPDDFALTHCKNCAAGWTRSGKEGDLIMCLLDREPVLSGMTHCDRFEPKAENEGEA